MRFGVLALQGAFLEHRKALEALGIDSFEIRQKRDIGSDFDALILPGGESTVMGKLLRELELFAPLQSMLRDGLPVFGTCAGLILLAKQIANGERSHFATMDITVRRNAYGRQLGSFYTEALFGELGSIPMTFIRAPVIEAVGEDAEVLAEVEGRIVAARQGRQLVTAFHPELCTGYEIHRYFADMVRQGENG